VPFTPYAGGDRIVSCFVVPYEPYKRHRRRSIRLSGWDYSEDGAYFVTICTHNCTLLFGRVDGDQMVLNPMGTIVEDVWRSVVGPARSLGEFVVMPNHVHGIVWIERDPPAEWRPSVGVEQLRVPLRGLESIRAAPPSSAVSVAQPLRIPVPLRRALRDGLDPGSLFVIVRTFKSAVAKRINTLRGTPGGPVWQRGYYERVLRNERELRGAREYILDNPRKWAEDKNNPAVFFDAIPHQRHQ
jgi:REP element-mobilizing transposase RayT